MRAVIANLFVATLLTAAPSSLLAADAPPALSHNPFSRPSSEVVRPERSIVQSDDGLVVSLPLQATMVGRTSRLANVAGRILKLGDEYQGYQLVAIHERYAVFERGGESTTVYVKPEQEEENDE